MSELFYLDIWNTIIPFLDINEHEELLELFTNQEKEILLKEWKKHTKYEELKKGDCIKYKRNGLTHRDDDQPAVIWANGEEWWYQNGKRHRDGDQPAIIRRSRSQFCAQVDDLPIIKEFYVQYWFKHGQIHRDNDKPALIDRNGRQE